VIVTQRLEEFGNHRIVDSLLERGDKRRFVRDVLPILLFRWSPAMLATLNCRERPCACAPNNLSMDHVQLDSKRFARYGPRFPIAHRPSSEKVVTESLFVLPCFTVSVSI
jgi:hypothetical protein